MYELHDDVAATTVANLKFFGDEKQHLVLAGKVQYHSLVPTDLIMTDVED